MLLNVTHEQQQQQQQHYHRHHQLTYSMAQSPIINLLTYLLTPWRRVLLEKLTGSAASQEIPRILSNPKVHYRIQQKQQIQLGTATVSFA